MEKILITGGKKLSGMVKISGSKNASLPILVATLLTDEDCVVKNVPHLQDVETILALLRILGKRISHHNKRIRISSTYRLDSEAPYELVKKMRASILVMGPLLGRLGRVRASLPGGCAIGARPINLHLRGFRKLGAKASFERGYVQLDAPRLHGANIYLDFPSVGATENLMMAATRARGRTVIENAASEPEIKDLANFLNKMGAKIKGAGTNIIEIEGVSVLSGTVHEVIPDRIETGTFMVAAAVTVGNVAIRGADPEHLEAVITKLREAGAKITVNNKEIKVTSGKNLRATDIETIPYPGFPTDMQAQWMVLMSLTKGTSIITETVFENRFLHVGELQRMGSNIQVKGNSAIVKGVPKLSGAPVMATDLRASAALILAALAAEGRTEIFGVHHLDRGYEDIEKKLKRLGARIKRVKE
ncbi:UDP-N-acetylglucosamine 1-carboxyvinyltransferase [bacterium]|nr:UDP-N-acetylglucosamine 1-carboxyvinyltransferase [bacterium]NIN93126.1 UDP-N-acetylglucosamine 1-carboxyvinyltransferase [bacterium]NIO18075.1 UDP-N-acetylglucosamine 1-carboxyvinyltransferase [bacterium]NIO74060.1 UDP-N-acetylglucosamine 1-carboxyvinyltransferase [bacterium]